VSEGQSIKFPETLSREFEPPQAHHSSAVNLLVQLRNHSKELVLCSLQVIQQSMTPFGIVRLSVFDISEQSVVSLIHSLFGFLYFTRPRHTRILPQRLKSDGRGIQTHYSSTIIPATESRLTSMERSLGEGDNTT